MSRTASPTVLTQTQLSGADAVLPQPYSGIVVHGDQKGRTIGYPTANLVCANGAIPHGVYATRCTIGTNTYSAMTFVGRKDAALGADLRVLVESHLFDANFDMYGQSIEVQFVKFIRPPVPVQSFTQLEQMLKQDERDCRHTLALWEAETGISSATPTA